MIPLLYPSNATAFNTLGNGELSEATRCEVYESRNGDFLLEIDIPANAKYISLVNVGALIVADANETLKRQAFEVYRITKPLNGIITAYAEHISYRLRYSVLKPFTVSGAAAVFARLNDKSLTNYIDENIFTFYTDLTGNGTVTLTEYASVRDVLGGKEGSILDTFGGCYLWDNFTVNLLANRGNDNGVRIVYGKNLKDIEVEYDNGGKFTAVFPYYDNNGTLITGSQIWESEYIDRYAYHRTIAAKMNDRFSAAPTMAQLDAAAREMVNGAGLSDVNLEVDVIPLHTTIEYKNYAPLERMQIDDTVKVYVPTLDVNVSAKVISTRYNVLLDRLSEVEIGNYRTTLADAIRAL